MQMQHDFEVRPLAFDDGSNLTAVMDFDHIGRAESVDMIEIGIGHAAVSAQEPAKFRRKSLIGRRIEGCALSGWPKTAAAAANRLPVRPLLTHLATAPAPAWANTSFAGRRLCILGVGMNGILQ